MSNEKNNFDVLVEQAMPYAKLCGDIASFVQDCAQEVERSGEPAFFLTTIKQSEDPKRFPVSLQMWSYDEKNGKSFVVSSMDVIRPEYRTNPHGFQGNHLVVALLETVRTELKKIVPDGTQVLTSHAKWSTLTHGTGYCELKTQRALASNIPVSPSPTQRPRTRLSL